MKVELFERDGRGIRITKPGEVFLRHATASLTALRQGIDSVSHEQLDNVPPVRVGALPTVSTRIMPRAMQLFLSEGTRSRIKIVTGDNAVLLEQLRTGELDLMVGRLAAPKRCGIFIRASLFGAGAFYCPQRSSASRTDRPIFSTLSDYPVLMPTRGSIIRPFVEQFLIANGAGPITTQVETVSDSFGRAFVRMSDAV